MIRLYERYPIEQAIAEQIELIDDYMACVDEVIAELSNIERVIKPVKPVRVTQPVDDNPFMALCQIPWYFLPDQGFSRFVKTAFFLSSHKLPSCLVKFPILTRYPLDQYYSNARLNLIVKLVKCG